MKTSAQVERLDVFHFRIPTDGPEQDGTLVWDHTDWVAVEARCGEQVGLGYSYASGAAAELARGPLASIAVGSDLFAIPRTWEEMRRRLRNVGNVGVGSMALSAVETALWDLLARVLGLPLAHVPMPPAS